MRILNLNIKHHAGYPWQFVKSNICYLQVKCNEPVKSITVVYGDPFMFKNNESKEPVLESKELVKKHQFPGSNYYSIEIPMRTHKLRYHFEIVIDSGETVFLSESGVTDWISEEQTRPFMVPFVFEKEHYSAPEWAKNLVWYQIFPERFHDEKNNANSIDFKPTRDNFFGGTLNGITSQIPYLKKMGIDGVYLNPIFQSNSNHRYDTTNYFQIDPTLGSKEDLRKLVKELHDNNMKIMLDGVYNHCGWDHPFFQDVIAQGKKSHYYNWFYIYDYEAFEKRELSQFVDNQMKQSPSYECFAFAANMPKWNTENPEVIDYLIQGAIEWTIEFEIDAWRLDVPDEVSHRFLRAFHERMRACNERVYIIGEIWQYPDQWIERALFDGTMDYPLYHAVRDFAMTDTDQTETFAKRVEQWYWSIPEPVHPYQWSFCSNHDIPRAMFWCNASFKKVEKAYFLTALLGGNLCVYYGDEIGMNGGPDPDNRRPMNWERIKNDSEQLIFFKKLIKFKHEKSDTLKLVNIKMKDAMYIFFEDDISEMFAVISDNQRPAIVNEDKNYKLVFGEATETEPGWIVNNYAAFIRCKK